ncbi:MAG TPA: hypothetical protein VFZ74_01720 [Burkholderiales bacterium]
MPETRRPRFSRRRRDGIVWGFDAIAGPVPSETSHTRTLKRAMEIAGSMQGLAERLGVTVTDLSDWVAGIRRAPTDVYLRALDLVARGRVPDAGD